MKRYLPLIVFLLLIACSKPSTIEVRNDLLKASLKNIYWGEVPVAYKLLPEETSGQVRIYEDAHYNLNFPEEFPLRFHIEVNGIELLLETDEVFKLGKENNLLISINDSTKVTELK